MEKQVESGEVDAFLKNGVKPQEEESPPLWRQVFATSGTLLLSVGIGCATGYSAILLPQLKQDGDYDIGILSWIASITCLPIFIGSMIAGWLMESHGRRISLLIPTIPFIIGWIIIAFAGSIYPILAGRFITGLCQGSLTPASSIFVGEISTPKYRGILLTTVSLALSAGVLISHLLGTFLHWKLTAVLCGLFPAVAFIILLYVEESPSWCASKGMMDKCKASFTWYRGCGPQAVQELNALITSQEKNSASQNVSTLQKLKADFRKPMFRKPLLIMNIFFVISQLSGITVVCYYTTLVMKPLIGDIDEYYAMLVIDVMRCCSMVIACVILRRVGRRPLALFSGSVTALSLISLAAYLYYARETGMRSSPVVTIGLMSVYVLASHVGIAPLPWTMLGEIFPSEMRGLGSGICVMVSSIAGFATVKSALGLFEEIGMAGTFLLYGGSTLAGTVYFYFCLPETKGKTLLQIEEIFQRGNKAKSSQIKAIPEWQR